MVVSWQSLSLPVPSRPSDFTRSTSEEAFSKCLSIHQPHEWPIPRNLGGRPADRATLKDEDHVQIRTREYVKDKLRKPAIAQGEMQEARSNGLPEYESLRPPRALL
jgi:hypothetical protein